MNNDSFNASDSNTNSTPESIINKFLVTLGHPEGSPQTQPPQREIVAFFMVDPTAPFVDQAPDISSPAGMEYFFKNLVFTGQIAVRHNNFDNAQIYLFKPCAQLMVDSLKGLYKNELGIKTPRCLVVSCQLI